MSSVFSVEMQPPPCERTVVVSENAQNIPQDLPVLG